MCSTSQIPRDCRSIVANASGINEDGDDDDDLLVMVTGMNGVQNGLDGKKHAHTIVSRYSAKQKVLVVCLLLMAFFNSVCFSILAPFFNKEAKLKDMDQTQIGIIFGSYEIPHILLSPLVGYLIGFSGPSFFFKAGSLVAAITTVLFGVLSWCPGGWIYFALAIATRVIQSAGTAFFEVATYCIIALEFSSNLAFMSGLIESILGLGFMLGPPIGGVLYHFGGFYLPFVVLGVCMFIAAVISSTLLPSFESGTSHISGNYLKLLKNSKQLLLCMVVVSMSLGISYFDPTLAPYLTEEFDLSELQIGFAFLIMSLPYSLSSVLWGHMADKGYGKHILLCGLFGVGISLILFVPLRIHGLLLYQSLIILGLLYITLGSCFSAIFVSFLPLGLNIAIREQGLPDNVNTNGLFSGLLTTSYSIGALLGPTIFGGPIFNTLGFEWTAMLIGCITTALGILVVLLTLIDTYCRPDKREGVRLIAPGTDSVSVTTSHATNCIQS